jgi:hypothetical protein
LHRWAKEADDRNDLYLSVRCKTRGHHLWLPLDEPERARSEIHATVIRWNRPGYDNVKWMSLVALATVELYAGAVQSASQVTSAHWEQFNRLAGAGVSFDYVLVAR